MRASRVHTKDRGEVARRRQPFTRLRLAIGDRASDLCSDFGIAARAFRVDAAKHLGKEDAAPWAMLWTSGLNKRRWW
jgi:hypothetical protein